MKNPLIPALLLTIALATPAHAGVKETHAKDLKRIEQYLTSLTTIVADFTQIAPDGELTEGKFYLKRPGKMRWQYEPPTPVLMIVNDGNMVYYDYELEQVTHIPIDQTLADFLAREKIDLNDPLINIEDFVQSPGMVRLSLSQSDRPEAGTIMLEFSDKPLKIRNMVVTDAQAQTTTVSLNNAMYDKKVDNELFVFKDPKFFKRRFAK